MANYSNLDLARQCDKFPYPDLGCDEYARVIAEYYKFHVEGCDAVLGFILPTTAQQLQWPDFWAVNHQQKTVSLRGKTLKERDERVAATLAGERERAHFKVLGGWRDELYPVYGTDRRILVNIERAASALFGIIQYGVHMVGFVKTEEGLKVWTPRRAKNKQTYPGMLDNTVGGGITSGDKPLESVVREATEEASFSEKYVRENVRCCGTVTYFDVRDERAVPGAETGLLQPECQYVYELEVPQAFVPQPNDMEAEDFQLWSIPQVQDAMRKGDFKPNCAVVLLDFFIRHGIITPEKEEDYLEIVARIHRKLDFPGA